MVVRGTLVEFLRVLSFWSEVGRWVGRGEYPRSFISLSARETVRLGRE